ncbi:MAG TPA: radical SAM protein [Polyangiales bacterium]|nr:radical SAM protein [Polyangiales bacterium]
MRSLQWVVKASKFCNLRCSYCYEWDGLSNRDRMPFSLWERVFTAMRTLRTTVQEQSRDEVGLSLVLHGGEPLTLPTSYLEQVMALGHAMLDSSTTTFGLQTNLYRLTDEKIDFIKRYKLGVGVSLDVTPGVRKTLTGKPTESTVMQNMRRLRDAGVRFGAITVLAKHTAPRILEIYDYFAREQIPLRILPLFGGPSGRPDIESFAITEVELVEAMARLFEHWMESGAPIMLQPFVQYYEVALRRMISARTRVLDRRVDGEHVFVVDVNGDLYSFHEDYDPEHVIGNLARRQLKDILDSPEYERSLERDALLRKRYCSDCEYAAACDSTPLFATDAPLPGAKRCAVAHALYQRMEQWTERNGFDARTLSAAAFGMLVSGGEACSNAKPTRARA